MSAKLIESLRFYAQAYEGLDLEEKCTEAADRIEELERQLAERSAQQEKDAALLDFLQAKNQSIYTVVDVVRRPSTAGFGRYEERAEFLGWSADSGATTHATVRDAIRAALSAQANQNGEKAK